MTGRDLSGQPGETVGSCPNCEWPLTRFDVLIEYETTGEQGMSTCPVCVTENVARYAIQ